MDVSRKWTFARPSVDEITTEHNEKTCCIRILFALIFLQDSPGDIFLKIHIKDAEMTRGQALEVDAAIDGSHVLISIRISPNQCVVVTIC